MTSTAPPLHVLFLSFLRLGATAFGGPAMIAYIRDLAVTRRGWLDEKAFRSGVVLCQSIPGATAMQTAAYVGLRVRGLAGGLATYLGFLLPGALLMLGLTVIYQHSRDLPTVLSLFHGLRAIVVALVANAALTFGQASLRRVRDVAVAILSATALVLHASPPLVILVAGLIGVLILAEEAGTSQPEVPAPQFARALRSVAALVLFAAVGLALLFVTDRRLFDLGLLMMRVDLFAFGGGFASIPLIQHEMVEVRGWMDARTFMDGIALGQVTPGPIVITATFVGYLLHHLPGAAVGTLGIFYPSFVLVALTIPVFDWLQGSPLFRRAVRGAMLAFVGLLLSATVQFGRAVDWTVPAALVAVAALTALRLRVEVLWVVLVGGLLSVLLL